MFFSTLLIPILKNYPSEAKIKSHKLMLRTGMIKQSSAGIYSWLPLGFKVMKKIENIVREEQNKIFAQEILMPTIQSSEIWKESGRYEDYGEEMLRITDRQKREMLYGPTNEELITDIFRNSIKSYKSLPQLLYHIQWKFRDELRPRFGIMRCREFYMKDAYSFDLNDDLGEHSYNKFFLSYLKTFKRLDLKAIPMAADTGPIGGNLSHEFIILAETGESGVYFHKDWLKADLVADIDYDANLQPFVDKFTSTYARADEKHDPVDCPVADSDLMTARGIEVGHIFYFGTKYSLAMGATVSGPDGENVPVHMGSYGIGVSRLVGGIIEANHDEKGIIWPDSVAPFDVAVLNLKPGNIVCDKACQLLYDELIKIGVDPILDDRDERPGAKLAAMDLIGIPWQIVVGPRGMENDMVEVKRRKTGETQEVSTSKALGLVAGSFLDDIN